MDSHLAPAFRANSQVMKSFMIIAPPLLLFVAIASFLWIGSILGRSAAISTVNRLPMDGQMYFPLLFQDLANLGLLTPGDRAVLLGEANCQHVLISDDLNLHPITRMDDQRLRSFQDNTLDFVFSQGFEALTEDFIAGALKVGGVAAVHFTDDIMSGSFRIPLHFKIVYLRQLDPTVLVMRKTGGGDAAALKGRRRRLLLGEDSAKRSAVDDLEDLLLGRPHGAAVRRHGYRKRTKYSPDITGDLLNRYPRRVFVNVESSGHNGNGRRWFEENYPTRGWRFEVYEVDAVASVGVGMSEWLRRTVGEEGYVVMKAAVEVVEEIFSGKAIFLVDEISWNAGTKGNTGRKRTRA